MAKYRGGRSSKSDKRKAQPGGFKAGLWLWAKRIVVGGIFIAILGGIGVFTSVYFAAQSMPSFTSLKQSQNGQTILVRARDGSEIVELGPSYGQWVDARDIPQVMKDAMVSVEDHRFYSHFGVDPVGLARAVYNATLEDRQVSATSTISQQLARNIFLNSNRTLDRKLREAVLAMALEWNFSKDQILELYLNKVYFGGGAYGIDSASRKFFSHAANELSLEEAAIIAGLVKAPSRYSPTADIDAAVSRANVVIGQMVRYGDLDPAVARQVDVDAVNLREDMGQNSIRYFTDWALPQLDLLLPNSVGFEPIEVWTTIDVGMQRAATTAVQSNVPDEAQGAMVSLDRDGAVLALVGGTDYVTSNYNRATDALRQPGSSFKLFVYLAALEAGYTPDDRVQDVPVTINGWSPRNSGGNYAGEIDVRTAFAYSKNSVAAQLGNEVGFSNVASMARRFGITSQISTYPSMVLGSSEVRLIDMARAFAAVSAGGQSVEPYGIVKVTTADGEEIYRHQQARSYRLVPDYVAAGITDLLQTAVATGTGRAAQIGRPVAGKTGTTNTNRDGYFVGFSSGITTGVWMGRDDNERVAGLQGGTAPARAFAAFMRYAVRDRPEEEFDTDLQLPQWQLEPDDEFYMGEEDDYYYYIDDQGNLVEPGRTRSPRDDGFDVEGEGSNVRRDPLDPRGLENSNQRPGTVSPDSNQQKPPPAASDDFLERATGQDVPGDQPRQRQSSDDLLTERRY
ncbi:penicillin-binding protein [Aurantiacibacter atlanticus]|uniref:Penicillin-binding protein n=1 Tax=Aurantiacibacter atlanticus TaxID=1648404 RepID=A0A0H4V9N2_9SPHN|nr:PBP1A family penicillin-binding protein [Aurantiacibacter atlanticus]AKQ41327.1 penicillin-binding protein [Aurantiacibacter atlanticus]MDF1834617.1 PBP1A family penicillin-binding protein [Alteraurantiacibacter sp. bin_em_oilr2.035]